MESTEQSVGIDYRIRSGGKTMNNTMKSKCHSWGNRPVYGNDWNTEHAWEGTEGNKSSRVRFLAQEVCVK